MELKKHLKSIFKIKMFDIESDNIDYDKYVNFYHSNLINSLILFSLNSDELEKLAGPLFNPLFELESEIEYAFLPILFETIFRNKVIEERMRIELLNFKREVDDIQKEIWDWEFIDNHKTWIQIRKKANDLLDKLQVKSRIYNDK